MDVLNVSVIIPVYNAVKFVRHAVESVVNLTEAAEIILVDDGYPDGALEICKQLEKEFRKVKLYQHSNGQNRGAGASRNLGIQHASCDYISFLDADDYYLPNRFEVCREIFIKNKEVDGVYDAVGIKFFDNSSLDMDLKNGLTTIPTRPAGIGLFETLIRSGQGHFHTNGIVVKKKLIEKAGFFNPNLKLHQDTDLWIKLAYLGNIVPGLTDQPVAIRCVHGENRIGSRNFESRGKFYKSLFDFFSDRKISKNAARELFRKFVVFNKKPYSNKVLNIMSNGIFASKTLIKNPKYISKLLIG